MRVCDETAQTNDYHIMGSFGRGNFVKSLIAYAKCHHNHTLMHRFSTSGMETHSLIRDFITSCQKYGQTVIIKRSEK